MLSHVLPEPIGARVEIPNDESILKRVIEAYGFFADHIDHEKIVLRRQAPNDALRGSAIHDRATPIEPELLERLRILPA